ncbi:hypothetical protein C2857_007449 [Epichloe festucae Fl1]|uniref:Uncharacterized protein n=1 Tax=Epichloe festucae (strain Fl1) TaxID=877507 RepID=A0A7S9PUS8_EPIFF|nr:hypothetical protein C2857_007449 [Epichloe festucae Fl1]
MSSDMLQMHEYNITSPPQQAQPVAGSSDRGAVSRARYPSACKECRRRKQKPTCEYGVAKIKRPSWGPPPGSKDGGGIRPGGSGLYSHLDLDSIHDAILDVEGGVDPGGGAAVDNFSGTQPHALPTTYRLTDRERPVYSMKDESWAGDDKPPFLVKFRDSSGLLGDRSLAELVQFIMQTRLRVANRIVQDEWEIDGKQLVRALLSQGQPSSNISSLDDQMHRLPMEPTKMNKELVRTHLQLLSRFKASFDGSPRPNNRFMKHWIPFSIQDRLVLRVSLCTTASFLHETGRLPKMLLHIHRATTTSMLNEYISSPTLSTSDSAMLAVCQLILTSWYWSSTEELHAHMAGFKRMIQLRGGCQNLGMQGYTSKIALVNDMVIALCHDTEPLMFGQPGFEFEDPFRVPLQVSFNSPLLFNGPPFLIPSSTLRLHKTTSEILDSTRAVFQAVMELPDDPGEAELRAVSELATSLLNFLSQLPDQVLMEPPDAGHDDFSAASAGQKRRRRESDDPPASSRTRRNDFTGAKSTRDEQPDLVYLCVRLTALIWAKAILQRVPTSHICTETEFARIWSFAWAVGLERWSCLIGVFAWMSMAIAPLCHNTIHARMFKTITVTTFTYMGTENWHVAMDMATAGLRMQAWLRAGKDSKPLGSLSGASGGEQAIEDFGFVFKENDIDLPDHRYVNQSEDGEWNGSVPA